MPTAAPVPPPEKTLFSLSTDPIDVIICGTEKELSILDLTIEAIQTHVAHLGRIIVISPTPISTKAEWFDPKQFPFSKESLLMELFPSDIYSRKRCAFHPRNQLDSILSHLMRLYAPRSIPHLSENVLVIDPNVIFLHPIDLMDEKGNPLFNTRGKQIKNHLSLGKKVLPSYFLGEYHEIAHFVLIQKAILDDFFAHFEEEPWKAICRKIDKEKIYESSFSALSLYGNFALHRTDQAKLHPLQWEAISDLYDLPKYEKKGSSYITYR